MEIIAQGRDDMKLLMGASSGEVFIGESGTELLGRLIRNATLASSGAKILGSHLEHPATYSAGRRWAEVAGMTYEQVDFDTASTVVSVEQYRPALTPDLAVATIIHASPVTGMHVDVKAIAAEIRAVAPECFIIVDGIQHAAHGHVAVDDYGIDGYVVSGYKLFSRHNFGVAWVSDRPATAPHDQPPVHPPCLGTRHTHASAYAAFSEVVRYLEWLGAQVSDETELRAQLEAASAAIRDQEQDLVDAMMWGTGGLPGLGQLDGVHVVGPEASEHRPGWCHWIDGHDSLDVVDTLNAEGVRTHARKRTITRRACSNRSASRTAFVRRPVTTTPEPRSSDCSPPSSAGRIPTRGSPRQPHPSDPPPLPVVTPAPSGGAYRPLSDIARDRIVEHAFEMLEHVGMADAPDRYAELLIAAGGRRRDDGRVLLPRPMVEAALDRAPSTVELPASSTTTVCRSEGRVCTSAPEVLPCRYSMPPPAPTEIRCSVTSGR